MFQIILIYLFFFSFFLAKHSFEIIAYSFDKAKMKCLVSLIALELKTFKAQKPTCLKLGG